MPIMKAMHSLGGEASNTAIYKFVVEELALSPEQLSVPVGKDKKRKLNRVGFNINFAKTGLKNAGYLVRSKAKHWQLTEKGKETENINPDHVMKVNREFYKLKKRQKLEDVEEFEDEPTYSVHAKTAKTITVYDTSHDEIQWRLLSLGSEMKLDLWVAKNDRNKAFQGNKFSETKRMRSRLPVQFDQETQRTIELIDVLWLQGSSIIAAFEIEHTTSIYSGILRMSDLVARQPNININLFIVAPDSRREKVRSEINRPTFSKLGLPQRCRYISYSRLIQKIDQATRGGFLQHLSPSILDGLAEDMKN